MMLLCFEQTLVNVTLRLLLNLSFDFDLRQEIVREAVLPKLTSFLGPFYLILSHIMLSYIDLCLYVQEVKVMDK